ncbi:MAG: 7-carboxy-7-deazaguanine synthase QueE [Bacteroidetes bacterium]|nr:MAG: 7-carboxy-7-deazaguanine synthase QueE [Bacteroidota bacterium]
MEAFYTLQGEGYFNGQAAYFIRLGGCDVGCVWCDVKESWDANSHPKKSIATLVADAQAAVVPQLAIGQPLPFVVITGGEPLLHNLEALTTELAAAGFRINIETSGSSPLTGKFDWVCLSPKKFKAPLPAILPVADELKIVVFHKTDFAWAESFAKQVSANCKLYLQPEWDKREQMTPLIVDYIMKNPKWQLSLQTHKYIGVP